MSAPLHQIAPKQNSSLEICAASWDRSDSVLFLVGGEYLPFNAEATMAPSHSITPKIMKLLGTPSIHTAEESRISPSVKIMKDLQQSLKTLCWKFTAFLKSFVKGCFRKRLIVLSRGFPSVLITSLWQPAARATISTSTMLLMEDKPLS